MSIFFVRNKLIHKELLDSSVSVANKSMILEPIA